MLICGKINRVYMNWTSFSTIKVLRFINKNFRTWPQPLLPQDNLHSWGLEAKVTLRIWWQNSSTRRAWRPSRRTPRFPDADSGTAGQSTDVLMLFDPTCNPLKGFLKKGREVRDEAGVTTPSTMNTILSPGRMFRGFLKCPVGPRHSMWLAGTKCPTIFERLVV